MINKERLKEIKTIVNYLDGDFTAQAFGYEMKGQTILDDVRWLIKRIEELEEENNELAERFHRLALDWSELVDEINRYKQALEFYADEDNYCVSFEDDYEPILQDNGKIARQALEEDEN